MSDVDFDKQDKIKANAEERQANRVDEYHRTPGFANAGWSFPLSPQQPDLQLKPHPLAQAFPPMNEREFLSVRGHQGERATGAGARPQRVDS